MQCKKLKTYMETGRVIFLPIRTVRPNPSQPRKVFRPDALEELAECIPGTEQVDDQLNARELARTIRKFLNTLPKRHQDIFLQRYFFVDDADNIAVQFGMKRTHVNVILSRTRQKLKNYLRQEGYDL